MPDQKLTSAQWQELYPNAIVLDPDGWDRLNYQYSWHEELITYGEYQRRLSHSTVIVKNQPIPCK
jgi:hypothetical protein